MLPSYRSEFNQTKFSSERYAALVDRLCAETRTKVEFRVCETPVFLPQSLMDEMIETGRVLTHQLVDNPEYMRLSESAIPDRFRLGNDNPRPNFMTVDFGLIRDAEGKLHSKLVELQAFPSVFGYQDLLARTYKEIYGLDASLACYLDGHTEASYWELLRKVIVGDHDPKQVVLLETDPLGQKTLPDFRIYEQRLGIAIVDIGSVKKIGRRLAYEHNGEDVFIKRIFNRTIVDEMERKGVTPGFDYRDELDVEWAGHPNWYFRISKFSIPHLNHPAVPAAVFLDQWFAGIGRDRLPTSREDILLKPLYSFAGKGIHFAPTDADLEAIPVADRSLYLLQERVRFAPVIETPHGLTQAEIRLMYVWPDDEPEMRPLISLVRLGRGLMMGVDQNRNQEWVGGSAGLMAKEL